MTIRVAALAVALLSPSPAEADSFVLTIAASEGRPGEARLEHAEHDAAMVASAPPSRRASVRAAAAIHSSSTTRATRMTRACTSAAPR
jgi:hypothetical protein